MRKVILNVAVSLDGFIEGPHGEYDWCMMDQDYGLSAFFKRIDAIFYGRKSYEMVQDGPNQFGKMKGYVFSNTLKEPRKGIELISGNIVEQVKKLKSMPGKDIWLFGGASLTTSFINV